MEDSIAKAGVLVEALPYIQSFKDKIIVIKYGGSTIKGDTEPDHILLDVVFMAAVGMKPVMIHGGGKAISRRMKEAGIESTFVNGLRVTDQRTMQIVEDTLFGEVNRDIVQAIHTLGGRAKGLSAKTSGILNVRRHVAWVEDPGSEERKAVDIGFVGDVEQVDPQPILQACEEGWIPVITPIGRGGDGQSYNINADTAAGEIAAALKAEKLVFLTDVKGILRDPADEHSLLSTVHVHAIADLIREGVVQGGMIPKVQACLKAVQAHVHKTHIIDGRIPHSLLLEIYTDQGVGTQIVT